jgi:cobalamin synthase
MEENPSKPCRESYLSKPWWALFLVALLFGALAGIAAPFVVPLLGTPAFAFVVLFFLAAFVLMTTAFNKWAKRGNRRESGPTEIHVP